MTGFRLSTGGSIDRARPIRFRFDGRAFSGFAGDTLASALLANGVVLTARSFKLHRPRGVVTAGPEEPNALVTLRSGGRREPNRAATTVELYDGLEAESQNRFPSLNVDLMGVNGLLARFLPAGFYYKTFTWPAAFWERIYEPLIRRAAGLGRLGTEPDPDGYTHRHAHCDVLVIGAGPAGLAAADEAIRSGARVIVLDQDAFADIDGMGRLSPPPLRGRVPEGREGGLEFAAHPPLSLRDISPTRGERDARLLTRTTAISAYDGTVVAAIERVADHLAEPAPGQPRQRLWLIRAARIVIATGATERLIAFPGNDRPGIMLAGAVATYLHRYGVACGRQTVVFTNNDAAYAAAFALHGAGQGVFIVDPRQNSPAMDRARALGLTVHAGHQVVATAGFHALASVTLQSVDGGAKMVLKADCLAVSGGFNPSTALASQLRVPQVWRDDIAAFAAVSAGGTVQVVGAAAGDFGQDLALQPLFEVKAQGKAFVDLQHDVTADDVRLAVREGYAHVEHMKRYTTHGMATDQGRIGGLVGSAILAEARGISIAETGLPTPRPYLGAPAFGALAGAEIGPDFKPERRLALHDWHKANGAVFVRIGLWLRPLVYSKTGDTSWGPVLEEARATRRSVGLSDVSSLGKIDVQGPDAAAFLERIYANPVAKLAVGRARYGLMLREDGIVYDDGTIARLGPDHFLLSTTTAKSDEVLAHLEWHLAAVWPDLDVALTNVADQWAQFAVAGPKSRDVLAALLPHEDVGNDGFPFMAVKPVTVDGIQCRLFRISFSGELAYELAVPAIHALAIWEKLLAAGAPHGIRPYGLDALNLMRIEKGHVAGSELNGQTSAHDLGLEKMLRAHGDYVGKVLAQRPGVIEDRLQLVGLRPVDPAKRLRNGAHFVSADDPSTTQGYVTAICMASETDGWLGLGLLQNGRARHGERLTATSPIHGETVEVAITSPHALDPENARVRA